MSNRRRAATSGFTLIEILIVIVLISILASLTLYSVVSSVDSSRVSATESIVSNLSAAISQYQLTYRDYPPTSLERNKVRIPNDTNNGIESLLACLTIKVKGGPFYTPQEDILVNTDGDSLERLPAAWYFGDGQLREVVDPWGNPLIYFHFRDYEKPDPKTVSYIIGGKTVKCEPQKSDKTKLYHAPGSFQIWSAGANGINENGGGDDIKNW